MSWLSNLFKAGKVAAKELNWQLLAWKVGLAAAILVGTYGLGVYNTKVNYAEAEADRVATRAEKIVEAVEERTPDIVKAEVKGVEYRDRMVYIKEKLNEEATKAPTRAGCNLTPDELQLYREVAELTRVR